MMGKVLPIFLVPLARELLSDLERFGDAKMVWTYSGHTSPPYSAWHAKFGGDPLLQGGRRRKSTEFCPNVTTSFLGICRAVANLSVVCHRCLLRSCTLLSRL